MECNHIKEIKLEDVLLYIERDIDSIVKMQLKTRNENMLVFVCLDVGLLLT